ncbi:endonuclease domain-containing 1 protein-like [Carassius carassius]|uniref:endonuclease domain-containing 1 protein-like n=1 Tax=Carassius carassius TaxID=217509 RepID=UPI00286867FA|nr:endonuclease domain-containing 1 protein-like [Carassius carassius]
MIVLGLITCIVLRAFTAQAKVDDSFAECLWFFYKETEPSGMDPDAKKICQMLKNEEYDYTYWYSNIYYATLYSVHHKIPLYSAYTLDPACLIEPERRNIWHLEPQIFHPQSPIHYMVPENRYTQNLFKGNQAISSDYSYTGYDRGHLNPNSFQYDDGRKATFTLTNAAPMIRRFNQKHWKNWEGKLRDYLLKKLNRSRNLATAFIVTGTVPDPNVRIPHRVTSDDPPRVTVPSHIWTAVCYKHLSNDKKSFSFGYIGRNHPEEPDIRLMRVSDLNDELSGLYSKLSGTNQSIQIFADDCFGDNTRLFEVQSVFQKFINIPVNQVLGIENMCPAMKRKFSSDSTFLKQFKFNGNTGRISFDTMSTYYILAEMLKIYTGSACLITYAKPLKFVHDELRIREVSAWSDAVECLLVPEKQMIAADGSHCSSPSESDYNCQCNTGSETKPCCSSPCLYQDDLKGYRCYSDQTPIECSPRYSLITYNGKTCLNDYPCATYGYDYYWCKISLGYIKDDWDYCSPPLWNSETKNGKKCRSITACANYGYKYTWCYTDDDDNWDYC